MSRARGAYLLSCFQAAFFNIWQALPILKHRMPDELTHAEWKDLQDEIRCAAVNLAPLLDQDKHLKAIFPECYK